MASSQASDRTRDEPNSKKSRAIVEVARELGAEATNADIADEVEDRIGDRPDPSWVSRVRKKYVGDGDSNDDDAPRAPAEAEPPTVGRQDIVLRIDTLAGRLDRFTSNVEAIDKAVADLERRVEELEDTVDRIDADADREELAEHFEELSDRLRGG